MAPTPPLKRLGIALQVLAQEGFDRDPTAEQIDIALPFLAERVAMPAPGVRALFRAFPLQIAAAVPEKYEVEILNDERVRLTLRAPAGRAR